jgi:hypothetical protein
MFGMMPVKDIEATRSYLDHNDMRIRIDANKKEWLITWADYGTDRKKNPVDDVERNIEDALAYLASRGFPNLTLITKPESKEV